jgi:hypothetical protein
MVLVLMSNDTSNNKTRQQDPYLQFLLGKPKLEINSNTRRMLLVVWKREVVSCHTIQMNFISIFIFWPYFKTNLSVLQYSCIVPCTNSISEGIYIYTDLTCQHGQDKAIPVTGHGDPRAHRWWSGCQPYVPAALNSKKISDRGWVNPRATAQLQDLVQLKNRITSKKIEPMTFRLGEQSLNQLVHKNIFF